MSKKLKFQLLSEEEIKYATASAHMAMAKQIQSQQDRYPFCVFDLPEVDADITKDSAFREGTMRTKQISKRVIQIKTELNHLKKMSKTQRDSVFVPPLVLETMNRRWEEYCCSTRRTLFNLRREVLQLNSFISFRNPNEDKFMRKMSLSVRSILLLLQGLTKYSDKIHPGEDGRALYFEIAETAKNILKLASSIGIMESHSKSKEQTDTSITESSLDPSKSFVLESSDLNSEVLNIVAPENIRKNLVNIVSGNRMKKGPSKSTKYMAPSKFKPKKSLSQEKPFEELPDGRRIQLVQDSLSPILKQKAFVAAQSKSVRFHHSHTKSMKNRSFGNPEKMADVVFEQLLPHIKESRSKDMENSTQEHFSLQITNLLKRLTILEQKRKMHSQYLSDLSHSSRVPEKKTNKLEDVIGAANQSLFEASRLGLSVAPPVPTDIQPPETLAMVKQQKEEFWVSLVKNNYLPSNSSPEYPEDHLNQNKPPSRFNHSKPQSPPVDHTKSQEQVSDGVNQDFQTGPPQPSDYHVSPEQEHDMKDSSQSESNRRDCSNYCYAQVKETRCDDFCETAENKVERDSDKEIVASVVIPEQVGDSFTYESTSGNSEVLESGSQFFD